HRALQPSTSRTASGKPQATTITFPPHHLPSVEIENLVELPVSIVLHHECGLDLVTSCLLLPGVEAPPQKQKHSLHRHRRWLDRCNIHRHEIPTVESVLVVMLKRQQTVLRLRA
ncbi:unnamed protein product, partial [Sphacelaria rigidula]